MTKEAAPTPGRQPDNPPERFAERLSTPLWWYPVALAIGAIIAAEFRVADESLTIWIPFGVLPVFAAVVVWSMGRQRVWVTPTELFLRDAHLPLSAVATVLTLDPLTLRRLVGRFGDPAAYLSTRPWIGPGVQIVLSDPEDPTPYWIVSSRHPYALAEAVRQGMAASGS